MTTQTLEPASVLNDNGLEEHLAKASQTTPNTSSSSVKCSVPDRNDKIWALAVPEMFCFLPVSGPIKWNTSPFPQLCICSLNHRCVLREETGGATVSSLTHNGTEQHLEMFNCDSALSSAQINFFIFIRIIKILVSKLRAHQMRYSDYKFRWVISRTATIGLAMPDPFEASVA